jgi:hypothetical protein
LSSVDLPTFGRPTKVTKPERNPSGVCSSGRCPPRPASRPGPRVGPRVLRIAHSTSSAVGAHGLEADEAHPDHARPSTRSTISGRRRPRPSRRDRHPTEQPKTNPPRRVPVALGQLQVQLLVDVVDVEGRVDQHVAVGQRLDVGNVVVELVGDLADQLLEQVLERGEPGGAAVLVDDDRHVGAAHLHLGQQLGDPFGLGHEQRRVDQLGTASNRHPRARSASRP